MRKFTPKPSALLSLRILILISAFAAAVLVYVYLSDFKTLSAVALGAVLGVSALFAFVLLPIYFRRTVIYLSPTELTIHTGMFFKQRSHMKTAAVQYISSLRLPFSKLTGFNFLSVHGLGGKIVLPFLSDDDAEALADSLELEIKKRF